MSSSSCLGAPDWGSETAWVNKDYVTQSLDEFSPQSSCCLPYSTWLKRSIHQQSEPSHSAGTAPDGREKTKMFEVAIMCCPKLLEKQLEKQTSRIKYRVMGVWAERWLNGQRTSMFLTVLYAFNQYIYPWTMMVNVNPKPWPALSDTNCVWVYKRLESNRKRNTHWIWQE